MSFDEFDDLDIDFDAADVEGRFLAEVRTVEYRRKENHGEGTVSKGVNVVFVVENDDTFEGQWVMKYYWLGSFDINDDRKIVKRPNASNIKEFKSFVQAVTGVRPEGNIKISEYGPQTRTLGKKEAICLTDLEGGHVMINVEVQKDKKDPNIERSVVMSVSQYSGSTDSDDDEEPF